VKKPLLLFVIVVTIFSSCTTNQTSVQETFSTEKYNLEMDYYEAYAKDGADKNFLTYKYKADLNFLEENYRTNIKSAVFKDQIWTALTITFGALGIIALPITITSC
jgi:hypothetical protein